jgi:RimJ/RimL family protein N-acetyltransferase
MNNRRVQLNDLKFSSFAQAKDHALIVDDNLRMIPIGSWILSNDALISEMANWRRQSMSMFFAQYHSTPEKTRAYLTSASVGQTNRILFLISDSNELVGHLGLSNANDSSAEIDNVMRGVKTSTSKLMAKCLNHLADWSFNELNLRNLTLKVSSINDRAIELYRSCGFEISEIIPLKRVITPELTLLTECSEADSNAEERCLVMTRHY